MTSAALFDAGPVNRSRKSPKVGASPARDETLAWDDDQARV
jgi:hypothetical protein